MRVILAALGLCAALVQSSPTWAQAYDYCAAFPNGERTVIIVDRSAAYRPEDVDRLHRGIAALRNDLEAQERSFRDQDKPFPGRFIEIRPVNSLPATSGPLFQGCLPACPQTSIWDTCEERAVANDRRVFWRKLMDTVAATHLTQSQISQGETPLAQVIHRTVRESIPGQLVIFSDFLEHHQAGGGLPRISFYSASSQEITAYLRQLQQANYLPNLQAVKVVSYGFGSEIGGKSGLTPRTGLNPARMDLIYRFWVSYFHDAGARNFHIEKEFPGVLPPPPPPPPIPEAGAPLK